LDVTDLLDRAPLLQVITATAASNGTLHKYLKQTRASDAGFRSANAGRAKSNSQDLLVEATLKIIDGSFDTDVALAMGYKGGVEAWIQKELIRTMKQAMFVIERQMFYGTKQQTGGGYLADSGGFTGLANSTALDATADSMVIAPATSPGTTADAQTSVWLIRHGIDDVAMVLGNDGRFAVEEEPTIIQKLVDATELDAGKSYPAYYVPVTGWGALQLGSIYSAGRICNIESKLDDDDIYEALSKFPSDKLPNVIAMNRKALSLLRKSRTATNATGAPAPFPTDVAGIPIVATDAIRVDEPVIA
jgi:hypothetical protein